MLKPYLKHWIYTLNMVVFYWVILNNRVKPIWQTKIIIWNLEQAM